MQTTKLNERFKIEHDGKKIFVERDRDGLLSITPCPTSDNKFIFNDSKPEMVRAIGELLIEASKLS